MEEGVTIQQFVGDEPVQMELPGVQDGPQWWDNLAFLLDFLIDPLHASARGRKQGYIVRVGLTAHDLVIAEMKVIGYAPDVRRISRYKVKVVKHTEGLTTDQIILDLGEPRKFKLQVDTGLRESAQRLVTALGGVSG